MNTNSLKRFATTARNILLRGVRNRLQAVGFNEDGSVRETPEAVAGGTIFGGEVITDPHFAPRWEALRQRIESHGVKEVVEEAAYTWFNRFMAIRILVRNGLAQAVLDYENPDVRLPRIVTDARAGKTPILSREDRASLDRVIADGRLAFEQFAILIRAYCENNPILRSCFGGITDYTSLLLPADILAPDNFIDLLNDADSFISPEDYTKPELIGWLYQFYISEKKDEVFAKKGGYDSDEIPAATQIFTPNWIVKYMVQNTIGRQWIDAKLHSELRELRDKSEELRVRMGWNYLVLPDDLNSYLLSLNSAQVGTFELEEFKCSDLSCGSGHILNEMFDLLMQLYEDDFYSPREAIEAIFTKNMVGLDLDIRARQLSQFALLLKACQRDSAFSDGHCLPRIYSFPDVDRSMWSDLSGHFNCAYQLELPNDETYNQLADAFELMADADALGSIMIFDISESGREYLRRAVAAYEAEPKHTDRFASLVDAFRVIIALTDKYAAICMNPPYMPTSKEPRLKAYAQSNYPDTKADLFAIFMDVAIDCLSERGKYGMINMQSWMFLSSFESLRQNIIDNQQIDSLLHLGPRTFDELSGEVVQNAAFVIANEQPKHPGVYYRLIDGKSCNEKREMFLDGDNRYIVTDQKQFEQIPGAPIAYWVSEKISICFKSENISKYGISEGQNITGDNNKYLRLFWECDATKTGKEKKWVLTAKGGNFRRWYGNIIDVMDWSFEARENYRNNPVARIQSQDLWYRNGITWNLVSSAGTGFRILPSDSLFNKAAPTILLRPEYLHKENVLLGFLNTPIVRYLLEVLNPTINTNIAEVFSLPIKEIPNENGLTQIVSECIAVSKEDWDAHETSWDFQSNPLLNVDEETYTENMENIKEMFEDPTQENLWEAYKQPHFESLRWRFQMYCDKWAERHLSLLNMEEKINRQFIEIYGLEDELDPAVSPEDITILQQGEISISEADASNKEKVIGNKADANKNITYSLSPITFNHGVIIKQFISYAIGCMMGRYRLDRPGLAIAHPNPTSEEIAPYTVPQTGMEWWVDDDGIVPMMGNDCGFHDNAANRFDKFIEVALGPDAKTDNLNFVREAIGKDIVDYLRNDFYADHKRMYQNRPIYWMFSSNQKGKRAAFQCLVYMHRMNRFTPEHIRTNYLLPYIETLAARETELSSRPSLSTKENKELKQIRADLDECRDYQLRLHEFADQQIEIDLDDGVVKNYATFAPVLAKLK